MESVRARRLVEEARVGRLATVTDEGVPHIVPCCFAVIDESIVSGVDAKPKSTSALRRLDNIRAHPVATLLVDHYDDGDWTALWWVRVVARARVVDHGIAFDGAIAALCAKYAQYREKPPPGPVIVLDDLRFRSWP